MSAGFVFHHTEEMPWACAQTAGVSYKSLRYDAESGAGAVLIHMCPGTSYPRNRMHKGAEILVLDGDLTVADRQIARGAYAFMPADVVSQPRTDGGCVLYVTFPGRVENLHAS